MLYSFVSMLEWFGLIPTLESFLWAIAIFKLWIGGKMLLAPLFLPIPPLSWSLRCLSYGRQSGKRRITIFFVNCDTGRKQYYIFFPKNKNKVLCRRLRNKCILIFTDVDLRGRMKGLVVLYYVFYWFLFTCSGSKGFVSNLFKLAEALKIFFGFSRIRVFFLCLGGGAMHQREERMVHFCSHQWYSELSIVIWVC